MAWISPKLHFRLVCGRCLENAKNSKGILSVSGAPLNDPEQIASLANAMIEHVEQVAKEFAIVVLEGYLKHMAQKQDVENPPEKQLAES